LHLSFKGKKIEDIAVSADLDEAVVEEMLESMADRAVLMCRKKGDEKKYSMLPTIPGLFEFPFMKGKTSPMHDKLSGLWEKYHKESMGEEFCGKPTPQMRVIPVEKSFSMENRAHPYEEMTQIIDQASAIAVTKCACRVSLERCDKPKEVCMIFGPPAEFLADRGYARLVDKSEAMKTLHLAEEAGLVHTSNNSADKASVICNCCSCCCTILRGKTELNNDNAFAKSAYLPVVDEDACTGCEICFEERCPMNAIEMKDGIAVIKEENCIGCGLCVSGCPSDAISLIRKENAPEISNTLAEMGMKVLGEKGKLERFMKLMK
jgi:electron transport complex protein RnfB